MELSLQAKYSSLRSSFDKQAQNLPTQMGETALLVASLYLHHVGYTYYSNVFIVLLLLIIMTFLSGNPD